MKKQYFYLEKAIQKAVIELSQIQGVQLNIENNSISVWYSGGMGLYCFYSTSSEAKQDWESLIKLLLGDGVDHEEHT